MLPKSLKTIEAHAFEYCERLHNVYCYAETPPSTSEFYGEFIGCPLHEATLHVPVNSVEAYKEAIHWRNFGNIVVLTDEEGDSTSFSSTLSQPVLIQCLDGIITLTGLATGAEVAAYSTAGVQLATATATDGTATLATGLEVGSTAIVKIGDNSVKVVVK